ncbi:MAG: DUF4340 domain-containing protein [Phycisphaerae bacterium]|nr:DUF4340 domain-containing protein [Phycisphaerae bacterium]
MRPITRLARTMVVWTVAVAAGGAWWGLRESTAEVRRRVEPQPIFVDSAAVDVEAVDTVRLERRDTPPFVFVRREGRWMQTEPFAADMDDYSVRQLVNGMATIARLRSIEEPADLAAFQLAPPTATLTLGAGTNEWTLAFGKRGVAGRAFVRAGDQPVDVVDAQLFERAVEMDPKEWRARELFPESLGTATRLRWILRDGIIELVREGRVWRMLMPVRARADGERVDEFLTALTRTRSDGFMQDQPKDLTVFGLASPVAQLAVDFQGDPPAAARSRSVIVGAPLGIGTADRYAMIDDVPSVLRLSTGTMGLLFPPKEVLIDPVASGARAADVKRIEIRSAAGSIELIRALDQWTMAITAAGETSAAIPAKPAAVDALLRVLCATRASEIAIGPFPTEFEVATVLLFGFDGKPLDVVRIARDAATNKWGFENGDSALRVHPPATGVPLAPADFAQ